MIENEWKQMTKKVARLNNKPSIEFVSRFWFKLSF